MLIVNSTIKSIRSWCYVIFNLGAEWCHTLRRGPHLGWYILCHSIFYNVFYNDKPELFRIARTYAYLFLILWERETSRIRIFSPCPPLPNTRTHAVCKCGLSLERTPPSNLRTPVSAPLVRGTQVANEFIMELFIIIVALEVWYELQLRCWSRSVIFA